MFASVQLNEPESMTSFYYLSSKRYKNPGKINKVGKKMDHQPIRTVNQKKVHFFKYVNKTISVKGEWGLLCEGAGGVVAQGLLKFWHTCMNSHAHINSFRWREGKGEFLLSTVYQGGNPVLPVCSHSMTCKDTPLRQQGHMEVLRWLLGKQGGYDEDESEDDGMERQVLETNAIN